MINGETNVFCRSFVVKLGDSGPAPIAIDLAGMVDPEGLDFFVLSQGAYFMSVLGQSTQKFAGLFGPLPVRDYYSHLSYLFSFELDDESITDERLEKRAYCVMALFFKRNDIESINFLRNYLEAALWRYLKGRTIGEINNEYLSRVSEVLQLVYLETSVERTENKVIIRRRVESAVTKTEIKQKILNLKDKQRWTIISDSKVDFPLTVEGLLGNLADQVAKYEKKGRMELAGGKIEARIIPVEDIRKGEFKNSNGIIFTFSSATKGIRPDNPQIPFLKEVLTSIREKSLKIAVVIEGEYETSQDFESSIASISSSIPTSVLFANPISFFPISRDFQEKLFEMIHFLLSPKQ